MKDKFQQRYLVHQKRKKKILMEIVKERHSTRIFADKEVNPEVLCKIKDSLKFCPSSCDRKAIHIDFVCARDLKNLLGGLLVGGVGWVHRAPYIGLIFAHKEAYKAGDEIAYMPYLDAGVVVQQLYLTVTDLGLKGCFVNPNIRDYNKAHFNFVFNGEQKVFCGAFAFGYGG